MPGPPLGLLAGKARVLTVVALPLLVTFVYFSAHYGYPYYRPTPIPSQQHTETTATAPDDWWIEFFARLESTRVDGPATHLDGRADGVNWRPNLDRPRPNLLSLTADEEAAFRRSHAAFVAHLPAFARSLPYKRGTTGIVTTASAESFGQTVSMVLMARQAGSRLPVEVVVDSAAPWVRTMCRDLMPKYNTTCVFLEDEWRGLRPFAPRLERFQWKVVAMVASSFQNVLFLDADCLLVRSPDGIFVEGAEPFASTGFVSWPDFWMPTASEWFYRVAGDVEVPEVTARSSSESGVMVYDKGRHADSLLLAAYYNHNGPEHYYAMLSQHGPGEGDKETFLQAAIVLDELRRKGRYSPPTDWSGQGVGRRKGYWDVKMLPIAHGRSIHEKWRGMFMQQMDPMEDYRAVMAALAEAKSKPASKHDRQRRRARTWANEDNEDRANDDGRVTLDSPKDSDMFTDSRFLASMSNLALGHDHGKFMFFHHNGVKPDFRKIKDPKSAIVGVDEEGKYYRMWGDPGWIVERFGRDVEKELWRDAMLVWCETEFRDVCDEMSRVFGKVFGKL